MGGGKVVEGKGGVVGGGMMELWGGWGGLKMGEKG